MTAIETTAPTQDNWLSMYGSKELIISVRRRYGSNKAVPTDIRVPCQEVTSLLDLLASNGVTPKETSSRMVFLDKMVDSRLVGVVEPMACALLHDDSSGMIEFCDLLCDNGFEQIGKLIASEWLKEEVAGIEILGYKSDTNKNP